MRGFGGRRTVSFHADRVDDGVGATTVRQRSDSLDEVGLLVEVLEVEDLDPSGAAALETFRDKIDPDHLLDASVERDATRHLADRAQAQHDETSSVGDAGVLDALPGGGQDVGQEQESVVRRTGRGP